ncbi:MAG TPA: ATP phosphoribosyltransferase regulatory subunit [Beijerinckia sp.]|nr:ATP phosphoribosyltransferase regulatory subunit [Beijerinckia sp.]
MADRSLSFVDDRPLQEAVAAYLIAAGYQRCEPSILQPASIFFDSGEDIRSQLYLTSDVSGAEYCLRPEYTIPVCRHYLASPEAGVSAGFSYCGPVFRYRSGRPSEFVQAGIESFGRTDREAADAEILTLALEAVAQAGQAHNLAVRIADAGLFTRLLEALDLTPQWRRRILRGHGQGKPLEAILGASLKGTGADHSGVLAVLEGADKQGARALVEDLLSIAGIAAVGGRTPAEIADRFLEQAAFKTGAGFPKEKQAIIEKFLAIEGDPDRASAQLRKLAAEARLDLSATLDSFDARLGFMAARGHDVASLSFATRFTRNLDYYTGFVFEAHDRQRPDEKPIVGGGRYDRLLRSLGAGEDIPAVGAAIWVETLHEWRTGDRA